MGRAARLLARGVSFVNAPGALSQPASVLACVKEAHRVRCKHLPPVLRRRPLPGCAGGRRRRPRNPPQCPQDSTPCCSLHATLVVRLWLQASRCSLTCLVTDRGIRSGLQRNSAQTTSSDPQQKSTLSSHRRGQLPCGSRSSRQHSASSRSCSSRLPLLLRGSEAGARSDPTACRPLPSSCDSCLTICARAQGWTTTPHCSPVPKRPPRAQQQKTTVHQASLAPAHANTTSQLDRITALQEEPATANAAAVEAERLSAKVAAPTSCKGWPKCPRLLMACSPCASLVSQLTTTEFESVRGWLGVAQKLLQAD